MNQLLYRLFFLFLHTLDLQNCSYTGSVQTNEEANELQLQIAYSFIIDVAGYIDEAGWTLIEADLICVDICQKAGIIDKLLKQGTNT